MHISTSLSSTAIASASKIWSRSSSVAPWVGFKESEETSLCQPIYLRGARVRERRGGERPLRDPLAWIEPAELLCRACRESSSLTQIRVDSRQKLALVGNDHYRYQDREGTVGQEGGLELERSASRDPHVPRIIGEVQVLCTRVRYLFMLRGARRGEARCVSRAGIRKTLPGTSPPPKSPLFNRRPALSSKNQVL